MKARRLTLFSVLRTAALAMATLATLGTGARAGTPPIANPTQSAPGALPEDLRGALLAASSEPFEPAAEGYRAHSGGLDVTLGAGGLAAAVDSLTWGLALVGVGHGEDVLPIGEAEATQADGRVEYRRSALTEWYRDTALGLEQGFTLLQRPRGRGELVLELALTGGLPAVVDADRAGVSFALPDGRTLRYDHLEARDANGAQLHAELRCVGGRIALRVDDRGAVYPLTIDPLVYLEQKVLGFGESGDTLGYAVALSGDTALVGAPGDDVGANADQGSAYIFVRSGGAWELQQQLTGSDSTVGDTFGFSVALDGDVALVGAHMDNVGANADQGSAYVFSRLGASWTQQAQLKASDGATQDHFGFSVALDGSTALVGARDDDVGSNANQGSAYFFTYSGATWTQSLQIAGYDGAASDSFGVAVALDGGTALIGAYLHDVDGDTDQGSAYVFTGAGSIWLQQDRLRAADGLPGDQLGIAVALDGDTALVGARGDDVGANDGQGSAYVFTRDGTVWSQQAQLTAADGEAGDYFGQAVVLDGDTALVSAELDDVGTKSDQGSAYVFSRSGDVWSQRAQLNAADGAASDSFGRAVALDGGTALVGAPADHVGINSDQGSATVFTGSGSAWSQQAQLTGVTGGAGGYFGRSVSVKGEIALVGAPGERVGANAGQGAAYVFVHDADGWDLRQRLIASDGAANDSFGTSVALADDGDTALVGAPFDDVGGVADQGSAYLFTASWGTWSELERLDASDGAAGDMFGRSVALAEDGLTALVGADLADLAGSSNQGAAYIFAPAPARWTQMKKLTASDAWGGDQFGAAVGLSGDTALVGAPMNDVSGRADQGSAYLFTGSGSSWSQLGQLLASDGALSDHFGNAVALDGETALVGAYLDNVDSNIDQGSAYVYVHSVHGWSQQAHLTAKGGGANALFGTGVALDGDAALVGAGNDIVDGQAGQGSAALFQRTGSSWAQRAPLLASDGAADDAFGWVVALSGGTALVGAYRDDIGANADQGSAYFYTLVPNKLYMPVTLVGEP